MRQSRAKGLKESLKGGDILPESLEYICFLCKSFQQASRARLFSKENEDSKFSSHLDIYPFISYAFLRTKYLISLTFILQFGYSKILKSQANTVCVPFLLIKNNVNFSKIIAYHFLYILSASVILQCFCYFVHTYTHSYFFKIFYFLEVSPKPYKHLQASQESLLSSMWLLALSLPKTQIISWNL